MIRDIEITWPDGLGAGVEALLAPRPFDHWGQRFHAFEAEGVSAAREIGALNSGCRAYLLTPRADAPLRLRYAVALTDDAAPDWTWRVEDNRHTRAAPELAELARAAAEGAEDQRAQLRRLIDHAASVFAYGHGAERVNAGRDSVPRLCGTTRGSCIDINTYVLAAARSLGIRGQYVAGYWFHPEKTATDDMHCWLAFEPDGRLVFWDLAHALKWGDSLGARIEEGLNPAGGRRVAMSCGRGLRFDTGFGAVEISHFSEPVPIGRKRGVAKKLPRPDLRIATRDPETLPSARAGAAA